MIIPKKKGGEKMRGIVNIKYLFRGFFTKSGKSRYFAAVLFLSVILLLLPEASHAKAESNYNSYGTKHEGPVISTDTKYNSIDTEYNSSDIQPSGQADDSIKSWDGKRSADTVEIFSEYETDVPTKDTEKAAHAPVIIDFNSYYGILEKSLSIDWTTFVQKVEGSFMDLDDQSLEWKKLISGNIIPVIQAKALSLTKALPPAKALPLSEADIVGALTASVNVTVRLKTNRDSQLVANTEIINSMIPSRDEVNAVFCAVQKQNRWITRQQTLF